jgi:hypothetical protein
MEIYAEMMKEARKAAQAAMIATIPTPIRWSNGEGSSGISDQGLCGYANVSVRIDARTKRGKAILSLGAHTDYQGGYQFSTHDLVDYMGQSYEVKLAACEAAAKVINSYGIVAHARGRLD